MKTTRLISLTPSLLRSLAGNPADCAKAASLIYVSDSAEGIRRLKKGSRFIYIREDKKPVEADEVDRIRKLVIPPAWRNVWICPISNGHIQATGYDALNRKQYKYHTLWNELRSQTKFSRLLLFGEKLPQLRSRIEADLSLKSLCEHKVLAAVISLMERTYIRIGNPEYEKLYGSYGLTTLKDKHVRIKGSLVQFCFRGKKGIYHDVSLQDRRLARIVKQCKEIPGKELFQYYDEQGQKHVIDSGSVNAYIKDITGEDFTAKDFRTWAGTLNAMLAFCELETADTKTSLKRNLSEVVNQVSRKLGNTGTVCRKYYIHPVIFNLYEQGSLGNYLAKLHETGKQAVDGGWTCTEIVLMDILQNENLLIPRIKKSA